MSVIDGAAEKIARGGEHIAELTAEIDAFVAAEPCAFDRHVEDVMIPLDGSTRRGWGRGSVIARAGSGSSIHPAANRRRTKGHHRISTPRFRTLRTWTPPGLRTP
jgi:hypothetical protein